MSLQAAAAVALGEAAGTLGAVGTQVQKAADAGQVMLSQAQTGKNPIFKINPPEANDPSGYAEDDEAIARGANRWLVTVTESVRTILDEVKNQTAAKLEDSEISPAFLTPGEAGFANRFAKTMADIGRAVTALTLEKDEGHQVDRVAETKVVGGKVAFIQGGTAAYLEGPLAIVNGRLAVLKGAQTLIDAGDHLVRADNELHRVKVYAVSAEGIDEIIDGKRIAVAKDDIKFLQESGEGSITLQAGDDFIVKSLAGNVVLHSSQDMELTASGAMTLLAASMEHKAVGTYKVEAASIEFNAAGLIRMQTGGPPAAASAPTADTVHPVAIDAIAADKADRKPGMLFETAFGRNPAGANLPRISPSGDTNR